jgi:Domain of unknown function (DUF305)
MLVHPGVGARSMLATSGVSSPEPKMAEVTMRRYAFIGVLLGGVVLAIAHARLTFAGQDGQVHQVGHSPMCATSAPDETAFLAENDQAMTTMMQGMTVIPSGDVDRDFASMMIPHHQGAIDMAQAELRHGHNEQLRRIAQEIIVEQQQEIVAMRNALGEALPPSAPAPDQPSMMQGHKDKER